MIIYLYIKTHNKTGLKYLGKTTRKDPHSYTGSGTYWRKHLNKHGYDYTTEILFSCSDPQQFKEAALEYSKKYNIVESKEWANLVPEQGAGGDTSTSLGYKESMAKRVANREFSGNKNTMFGRSAVTENNLKWYTDGKNTLYITEGTEPCGYVKGRTITWKRPHSEETRRKISESSRGKKQTEETRQKWAESNRGKKRSEETRQKMSEASHNRRKITSPDGVEYPSISSAARSLDMTGSQFIWRCVKNGDWVISKATSARP